MRVPITYSLLCLGGKDESRNKPMKPIDTTPSEPANMPAPSLQPHLSMACRLCMQARSLSSRETNIVGKLASAETVLPEDKIPHHTKNEEGGQVY